MRTPGSRSILIFYILIGYITLQLLWWTYLIINLLGNIHPDEDTFRSKVWMIMGELAVFLVLLIIAILKLRSTFRKEMALNARQRNFLMSVTHELKSPIASARLNLQTILNRDLPDDKRNELLERTLQDSERLDALTQNILLSSSLEDQSFRLHSEEVDLSALTSSSLKELGQTTGREHSISTDIQEGIMANVDEQAWYAILENLVSNACKYSPKGSAINCVLEQGKTEILFSIEDQGPGIRAENQEKVFEKFFREGNEETRKTKGTGLGLYIVSNLVKLMRGTVDFRASDKGTTFTVKLPANT